MSEQSEAATMSEGAPNEQPTPQRRRSTAKTVMLWTVSLVMTLFIGAGVKLLVGTGGTPSKLANAYGLSIADFRAQAKRESRFAPNLRGAGLDGKPLALSMYRGNVVVLNLWGSWCGPCRREEPDLVRVSKQYANRGVQFLGIDVDDQHAAAEAFRVEYGVKYPSFFDPSFELSSLLEVQAVPTTFIIDRHGRIFFRFTGAVDAELLINGITAALEGPSS